MTQQLRILALNWRCFRHPQAGGSELNLFAQARHWVKDGHEVTVLTADPGREHATEREELIDGIRVLRMGSRFTVYAQVALYVLRYGDQFDRIIDVANGIPFFTPLMSSTPGTLLVHHVHDRQWFSEFPAPAAAIGRFIERRIVPMVYRNRPIIAVSTTTRDALVELGVDEAQIHIVYNGVEQPAERVTEQPQPGPRIAYVGRLKRYKRLDLLVRAVATLRATFPGIQLDLAGDGDARPEIEALVETLGLQQHVTVHGFIDEQTKARILSSATVFATPSMHEGWGLSVIEANVYGCPAVAYDVPGLRVSIRHGETGLLADDDAAFCQALASILQDQSLREQLSAGARRWAATFSWEASAAATLRVLDLSTRQHQTTLAASASS
jgi:glycosyltransferase involved in cell wall biosynthesis